MVKLQRLTGMRPGEVCRMRGIDIDRDGEVWVFLPPTHKTHLLGKSRTILLGPQAQTVLLPFLDRPADAYLFTPHESYAYLRENPMPGSRQRKTPVYPSELKRRAKRKKTAARRVRRFRPHFTTGSYDSAVESAIGRARRAGIEVDHWTPNQLRHSRATELRRTHGLEAAQVILGHAKADVTQIYAERDLKKAIEIAKESG